MQPLNLAATLDPNSHAKTTFLSNNPIHSSTFPLPIPYLEHHLVPSIPLFFLTSPATITIFCYQLPTLTPFLIKPTCFSSKYFSPSTRPYSAPSLLTNLSSSLDIQSPTTTSSILSPPLPHTKILSLPPLNPLFPLLSASPSEEDEDAAGGFPALIAAATEERHPPPPITADGDPHIPQYNAAGDDPTLRPSKDDDAPRRRVSFEIRQLSDDSEADARRRRHCARKRSRAAASCRRVAAAATAPSSPALPVLSRVARQGFLARGRGCVKVFFPGPERAEAFSAAAVSAALAGVRSPVAGEPGSAAATALSELGEPVYAGWADLPLPTGGCGEKCYRDLVQLCRTYDPDSKLVLLVCVCVSSAETPGAGKWSRKVVSRCMSAKLGPFRLAPEPQYHHPRPSDPPPPPPPRRHHPLPSPPAAASAAARDILGGGGMGLGAEDPRPRSPITREMEYPETLVLRALPSENCGLAKREEAYGNVQKHLKRRGVSLRKQFPDVHRRLRTYVEEGAEFAPAAIHPRDGLTGRPFLCVILPEGAEEPSWEGEEGGRLKRVDVGATDEEEEEDEEGTRGRPLRVQEGGEPPRPLVETP